MKTNKLLGIMVLLALFLGSHAIAQASSGYLTTFNTRYGTNGTALNSCLVCHTTASASPSIRNSYGAAFGSHAHSYPQIEALDSDGDSFTNLQEIQARTFPGNASSHPAIALTDIAIQGANSVNASTTSTYTTTASYNNGTSKTVTATWSLTSPYATISAAGLLTAGTVTSNQSVIVNASYTESGVTKTAAMSVSIIAPPVALTSITIQGAGSVNATATSSYATTAAYSDGTSKTVSAAWSLTSPYATISAAGLLTAGAVTANQSVTVNASYTEGGVTKTATMNIIIVAPTPNVTLTGIAIQGANSVNASATSSYTATAAYSNGTSKIVGATWSLNSPYASISPAGLLTASAVTANQSITVNASYTEGGVTKTAAMTVSIIAPPVTLTGITIQGASSLNANSTSNYTTTATYNNGTSKAVTAAWSLTSPYASIDASGVLSAQSVTGNQTIAITASYTEREVTKTATKEVAIIDKTIQPPTLTGLAILGAAAVDENKTSSYTATAAYNDGSSKSVSAAWSLTSPYATIKANGILSALAVTGNQTVTIHASYIEGTETRTATKIVTIVDRTRSKGHLLFRDDFSGNTAAGSSNWEIASGKWSGKGGRFSSTVKANNLAVVTNVPVLDSFEAGRIESEITLTNKSGGKKPNAAIVFGYVDDRHYRYVRIQEHRISIGQVGDYEGETGGVRVSNRQDISLKTRHTVRVDVYSTGLVNVYLTDKETTRSVDDTRADEMGASSPLVSYQFSGVAAGQVGYAARKARTFFDDFYAWDETLLP
jgi:hypothetical protein